jgi:hypothetical protein
MQTNKFAQCENIPSLERVLAINPLNTVQIPNWDETKLRLLLVELHRLGSSYLGNNSFVDGAIEALNELPEALSIKNWLKRIPESKLWR